MCPWVTLKDKGRTALECGESGGSRRRILQHLPASNQGPVLISHWVPRIVSRALATRHCLPWQCPLSPGSGLGPGQGDSWRDSPPWKRPAEFPAREQGRPGGVKGASPLDSAVAAAPTPCPHTRRGPEPAVLRGTEVSHQGPCWLCSGPHVQLSTGGQGRARRQLHTVPRTQFCGVEPLDHDPERGSEPAVALPRSPGKHGGTQLPGLMHLCGPLLQAPAAQVSPQLLGKETAGRARSAAGHQCCSRIELRLSDCRGDNGQRRGHHQTSSGRFGALSVHPWCPLTSPCRSN